MLIFCRKNADISNIKGILVLKGIFSETTHVLYLRAKLQVSRIILTSFRQGVILIPLPTAKRTPKNSTQIRVNFATGLTPFPAGTYFLKINNGMSVNVDLVYLLLALNRFHTLSHCLL